MKKSLVALAVLGSFAAAASAQSSVTIYGLLDMGVGRGNDGTSFLQGGFAGKAWRLEQAASSRLGFRGSEDLGGGLSAQFQIEHRFQPDTGAQTAGFPVFWGGRSFVQLTSNKVGSVYLGREFDPAFWIAVKSDPFGNDGVGSFGGNMQYAGYGNTNGQIAPRSTVRMDNTIGFKSISFGGVTFQLATGLSEASQLGRNDALNVEYSAGPIYAGVGFSKINGGTVGDNNQLWNIGLHYDFGVAKVIAYYANSETNFGRDEGHAYRIGALVPVAGGRVKVAYGEWDPAGGNNRRKKFALGYDYPLSKRTNLYADVGVGKQDGRTATGASFSRSHAYQFGVKHLF